jgi:hypothetical protein
VREEEGEIFPKARSSDVDLQALGRTMMARREELQQGAAIPAIEAELGERAARRGQSKSKRSGSSKPGSSRKSSSRETSARGGTSRKNTSKRGGTSKRPSARSR